MFFQIPPKRHSLFFYLSVSYLLVYAVCALFFYLVNVRVISRSARVFDRQNVEAETREYADLLSDNSSSDRLVEEVAHEDFPASTLFALRVLDANGALAYATSTPAQLEIPGWKSEPGSTLRPLPREGCREKFIPSLGRHIQIKTLRLKDGRTLQLAKSTALENDQRHILTNTSVAFFLLASLFTVINGFWMMLITLRPIKQITSEMATIIETGAFDSGVPPVNSNIAELDTLGAFFNLTTHKCAILIKAMKDTLDSLAHDFRTPLTRIRGSAEVALNAHAGNPSSEPLIATLADIIDDCDSARIQLQNLMDIRELESGFFKLDKQLFDLKKTVSEVADLYAVLAEDKDIALLLDLPEGEVPVEGDHNRLAQVLANLIDNAVKYTPRNGQVRVSLAAEKDQVRVTVADTGIGIPEEEHALIWQRLFRSRNARHEKGLGLGLSLIKAVVDAHGGNVTLTSAPGQGSTFVLTLPRTAL